jgi:hypothetical protein
MQVLTDSKFSKADKVVIRTGKGVWNITQSGDDLVILVTRVDTKTGRTIFDKRTLSLEGDTNEDS